MEGNEGGLDEIVKALFRCDEKLIGCKGNISF
jgi:hypothetical protein